MAIYISQDLYLSGALDDGYINANNPKIGYRNLLEAGGVTATYEDDEHPITNVQNVSTGEYWKSSDNYNIQYVEMTISPGPVDYFAIAGHNLAGAELKLQYRLDPGDAWTDVTSPVIPGDNSAIMWLFTAINTAAYYRLHIEPSEGIAPRIAVIYLGAILTLQRRVYVGHKPVTYARDTGVVSGMSESGQFLGRVVRNQTLEFALSQQNVDPEFYREYVEPFVQSAITRPFFAAWRPSKYPEEVGFCWLTRDIQMENQLANGFVKFGIVGRALAPLGPSTPTELTTT